MCHTYQIGHTDTHKSYLTNGSLNADICHVDDDLYDELLSYLIFLDGPDIKIMNNDRYPSQLIWLINDTRSYPRGIT